MMKKHLIALAVLIASTAFAPCAIAQNNDWQGGFLRADGFNEIDGLEVFYKKADCNGETYIFIKLVNNNGYAVDVEWFNDILMKDFVWIKRQEDGSEVSAITVPANTSLEGSCNSNYAQLRFSLEEVMGENADEFHYARFSDYTIEKAN